MIILGHANTKLCTKYSGGLGNFDNAGIVQGSPLSAQLFIIYDDHAVAICPNDIRNGRLQPAPSFIRDDETETT